MNTSMLLLAEMVLIIVILWYLWTYPPGVHISKTSWNRLQETDEDVVDTNMGVITGEEDNADTGWGDMWHDYHEGWVWRHGACDNTGHEYPEMSSLCHVKHMVILQGFILSQAFAFKRIMLCLSSSVINLIKIEAVKKRVQLWLWSANGNGGS